MNTSNSLQPLAPIALFVYKRLDTTKKVVESLQANCLASESDLIIFSDGAKNKDDSSSVNQVQKYIKNISGFKSITIKIHEKNIGLAESIIGGVSQVINKYGKIIVLEDDTITSPKFLQFMNEALDFYKNEKRVWNISGWNYPINSDKFKNITTAFTKVMNCWGWATWKDRWDYLEKDTEKLLSSFTPEMIKNFDVNCVGSPFYEQLILNTTWGATSTWAIKWYATIFLKEGLCFQPISTFVQNIGFEQSATHTSNSTLDVWESQFHTGDWQFEKHINENKLLREEITKFYNKKYYKGRRFKQALKKLIRINDLRVITYKIKKMLKK